MTYYYNVFSKGFTFSTDEAVIPILSISCIILKYSIYFSCFEKLGKETYKFEILRYFEEFLFTNKITNITYATKNYAI